MLMQKDKTENNIETMAVPAEVISSTIHFIKFRSSGA